MPQWTSKEFEEFNLLTYKTGSRDRVARIEGRIAMKKFIDKHGKEKCDAMWAEIQKREK